jgi:hypothetical protein
MFPMKLAMLTFTAVAAVLLSAGVAAADMQPIPNPPEAHHMMHHHHMMMHHHHHHHMAK